MFSCIRLSHFTLVSLLACVLTSPRAFGFSLGIRPYAGIEALSVTSVKLIRTDDLTQVTVDGDVKRNPLFFGGDLVVTPLEDGKISLSTSVGFRATTAKTLGPNAYNDEMKLNYLPVGVSLDFAVKNFRTSGYFNYDLGMSPKLKLSVDKTVSSLDAKISSLSRMRFGLLGEFFISPAFGLFAQADYAMGSFKNDTGSLTLADQDGAPVPAIYVANDNKLKGLTFGGGISYYIMQPASQKRKSLAAPQKGKPKKIQKPASKQPKLKQKASPAE